jgi:hypothetical protein
MRVQPDVPNAVTGTVTRLPVRQERKIKLTVRLAPELAAKLPELQVRLDNYTNHPNYPVVTQAVKQLSVNEAIHDFLRFESAYVGMTINGFIARILADERLAPGTPQPDP